MGRLAAEPLPVPCAHLMKRLAQVQADDKAILVYATFPDPASAESVGGALVDRGLAACVNIIPGITSIYVWQGSRQRDTESVMIIKTMASLADQVVAETKVLHPYENPAIVVLPMVGGSTEFLRWISSQTGHT